METRIDIKKPCPENWETMKIGLHSRFCDSCQKNVIDFTNKDRREILEYLLTNRKDKVCGRVYRSQLDFSNTDLLITIQALSKQTTNTNIPFYLLTVGTMILASCNNNAPDNQVLTPQDTIIIQSDTTKKDIKKNEEPKDTIKEVEQAKIDPPVIPIDIVLGEIDIYHDTIYGKAEPYQLVDIMPEFKGGIDSLMSFVRQNLKYPDWEKENKIEGKVFVSFIVDKNGKIKEPKILRSVQGSKNFDKEVIRVINNMPDWTPGQQDGKTVDVQFNLPINFKL
ncbi:MAG: energy transducer TonB [Bacteroidetes bacterium]|nr:energy transducer TonB [Bacteroidota bacterium]